MLPLAIPAGGTVGCDRFGAEVSLDVAGRGFGVLVPAGCGAFAQGASFWNRASHALKAMHFSKMEIWCCLRVKWTFFYYIYVYKKMTLCSCNSACVEVEDVPAAWRLGSYKGRCGRKWLESFHADFNGTCWSKNQEINLETTCNFLKLRVTSVTL